MYVLIFAACCFAGYMIGITIAAALGVGSHKEVLDSIQVWPHQPHRREAKTIGELYAKKD